MSSVVGTEMFRDLAAGLRSLCLSIKKVPSGPPINPPLMIPNMAAATAMVLAPVTPAFSNNGAKARPVAGPPVKVTEPARTPNRGFRPRRTARPAPRTFWKMAATVAMMKKSKTCGPPTLRSRRLAPKPMVVKKAIINGSCSVVSKVNRLSP